MGFSTVTVDFNRGSSLPWAAHTRSSHVAAAATYEELRATLSRLGVRDHTATPDAFDELETLATR